MFATEPTIEEAPLVPEYHDDVHVDSVWFEAEPQGAREGRRERSVMRVLRTSLKTPMKFDFF